MPITDYSNIPGIPDPKKFGDPSRVLQQGEFAPFAIQEHNAYRAGKHYDVRLGPGQMLSWATRKPLPEPGGKIQLFQTPLHSETYGTTFEGEIPRWQYGGGSVKMYENGKMLVQFASPDKINIVAGHRKYPMRYTLIRDQKTPRKWLLINNTPTMLKKLLGKDVKNVAAGGRVEEALGIKKMHYKKEPVERLESLLSPKATMSEKIDGAAMLYKVLKDRVEAVSYRTSTTGLPIIHTERLRMPRGIKIPPELVGTILRGETYGIRVPGINVKTASEKQAVVIREPDPWIFRPVSAAMAPIIDPMLNKAVGIRDYDLRDWESMSGPDIQDMIRGFGGGGSIMDKRQELEVQLGGAHILRRLVRKWKNPDVGVGTKVLGTLFTPLTEGFTALTRSTHYDPVSHTVVVYQPVKPILAHELGHAEHAKQQKDVFKWATDPKKELISEQIASEKALRAMKKSKSSKKELLRARALLEGAYGTYVDYAAAERAIEGAGWDDDIVEVADKAERESKKRRKAEWKKESPFRVDIGRTRRAQLGVFNRLFGGMS